MPIILLAMHVHNASHHYQSRSILVMMYVCICMNDMYTHVHHASGMLNGHTMDFEGAALQVQTM